MCSSQSEPELTSSPPPVRNKMKILYSDWVFDDQEDDSDKETKKDNVIEEDSEYVPSESVEKPRRKRGRPRKSIEEDNSVKKPKRSAAAVKTKKKFPSDLAEVKSNSVANVGSKGNVINLDEWLTDEEVEEVEQKMDINDNQELSRLVTVAKPDEFKSSFEVPPTTPVKEMNKMTVVGSLSSTCQDQSICQPVSDQDLHPAPGLSPLPAKQNVRSGQPRMLKPLSEGVGRTSARPDSQGVKSEQKMDANDSKISPESVTSEKSINTSYDLTNTTPEEDISLTSTSPHQSPSPPLSDQGDHQAHAPTNLSARKLCQNVLPMLGPRSFPGQILVRPAQPRMPRPPRQGMGRGSARPAPGPRPAGARDPVVFPGPRMSNPRSLAPIMRSASHPQSQYFPTSGHPASYPKQGQSPSPSQSPNLSNLDVSIVREIAPPTRQGWVPPPGLSMVRVPVAATEPTLAISTLATALHQLVQVGGRKRSVHYRLTEEQIRALSSLGVGQEGVGGYQ